MWCAVQIMFNCRLVCVKLVCVRKGWHLLYFITCLHKPAFQKYFDTSLNKIAILSISVYHCLTACIYIFVKSLCPCVCQSPSVCLPACPYDCMIICLWMLPRPWDSIVPAVNETVAHLGSFGLNIPCRGHQAPCTVSLCIYYSVLTRVGSFCRGDVIDSARARVREGKEGEWRWERGALYGRPSVLVTLISLSPQRPLPTVSSQNRYLIKHAFQDWLYHAQVLEHLFIYIPLCIFLKQGCSKAWKILKNLWQGACLNIFYGYFFPALEGMCGSPLMPMNIYRLPMASVLPSYL